MRPVESSIDRLVLAGASPLFRPFFLGGLGLLALGVGLLIFAASSGRADQGSPAGAPSTTPAGIGVFLTVFGVFVAIVPLLGRFPYRREIIVDRGTRQIVRRDRTLVRLRQDAYPLHSVQDVDVAEARHPDGDPYFTLALILDSGQVVTLERFTDRPAAVEAARLIRDRLDPVPAGPSASPGPQPG
jgi:hypothetical protein